MNRVRADESRRDVWVERQHCGDQDYLLYELLVADS
jgi:hypothetical protein